MMLMSLWAKEEYIVVPNILLVLFHSVLYILGHSQKEQGSMTERLIGGPLQ